MVLTRDVEDVRTDHLGDVGQDPGQPVGVVGLVDVGNVLVHMLTGLGVADVVDGEAEGLAQIVEAMQFQALVQFLHPPANRG